jgi:hypothetical protein
MSAADRDLIATVASTVEGVNVAAYFRQTTKPGDGMVRLDRMFPDSSGVGFMNTWQVVVMLPQDLASAERFLESIIPGLLAALDPVLALTSVTPGQLSLDTGLVPCVFIEGARGAD